MPPGGGASPPRVRCSCGLPGCCWVTGATSPGLPVMVVDAFEEAPGKLAEPVGEAPVVGGVAGDAPTDGLRPPMITRPSRLTSSGSGSSTQIGRAHV